MVATIPSLANVKKGWVEVNQRCLVDKMLARYSNDQAVFRELLQNADDAGATAVEILLSKAPSNAKGKQAAQGRGRFTSLTARNNGRVFTDKDWQRVVKIAEGNPDEGVVGMFGVGFYSVFSMSDSPIIKSGSRCLMFQWVGDKLQTTAGDVKSKGDWTDIVLEAPKDKPIQIDLQSLAKFVSLSMCFSKTISKIDIVCDGARTISVSRRAGKSFTTLKAPSASSGVASAKGMIKGTAVKKTDIVVEAFCAENVMKSSRVTSESVGLVKLVATGKVTAEPEFKQSAERLLKKPLPKELSVALIYPGGSHKAGGDLLLLDNLLPTRSVPLDDSGVMELKENGRVFIGLGTHQTTGCGFHLSGPFIPTIERENVDFQDITLGHYNRELTSFAGAVSRLFYDSIGPENATAEDLSIHAFELTHPSPVVSEQLRDGFFGSAPSGKAQRNGNGLRIPCRKVPGAGLVSTLSHEACLPNHGMEAFDAFTPIAAFSESARSFYKVLLERKLIQRMSVKQLSAALKARGSLDPSIASLLLEWLSRHKSKKEVLPTPKDAKTVMSSCKLEYWDASTHSLGDVKFYVDESHLDKLPVPTSTLPPSVSSRLSKPCLESLGLKPLTVLAWMTWLLTLARRDNAFGSLTQQQAEQLLAFVEAKMHLLHASKRSQVIQLLKDSECVPTKLNGLCRPDGCMISSAAMGASCRSVPCPFDTTHSTSKHPVDLNIVDGNSLSVIDEEVTDTALEESRDIVDLSQSSDDEDGIRSADEDEEESSVGVSTKFLRMLGVSDGVPVASLLSQLEGCTEAKRLDDAIHYFASRQHVLGKEDWKALRQFPLVRCLKADGVTEDVVVASKAYFGSERAEEDFLGPKVLWRDGRHASMPGGVKSFLKRLGITSSPPLSSVLDHCAAEDTAMKGFDILSRFSKQYTKEYKASKGSFQCVPTTTSNASNSLSLVCPANCCLQPNPFAPTPATWWLKLVEKFGVQMFFDIAPTPSVSFAVDCWTALASTSTTAHQPTTTQFHEGIRYLAARRDELSPQQKDSLSKHAWVLSSCGSYRKPSEVFLDSSVYGDCLEYASLPSGVPPDELQACKALMELCGVRSLPTPTELASALVRFASTTQDHGNSRDLVSYMQCLEDVASNFSKVSADVKRSMAKVPMALATRRSTSEAGGEGSDLTQTYSLLGFHQVYLVDNTVYQHLLNPPCCPQVEDLERMYHSLGSQWLTNVVDENCLPGKQVRKGGEEEDRLQRLISERLPLMLHSKSGERRRDTAADSAEMLSNLSVCTVDKIKRVISFEDQVISQVIHSHENGATLCITKESGRSGGLKLNVLQGCDLNFFDLGHVLAPWVFKSAKDEHGTLLAELLQSPLQSLQSRGWPVSRLIRHDTRPRETARSAKVQLKRNRDGADDNDNDNDECVVLGDATRGRSRKRTRDTAAVETGPRRQGLRSQQPLHQSNSASSERVDRTVDDRPVDFRQSKRAWEKDVASAVSVSKRQKRFTASLETDKHVVENCSSQCEVIPAQSLRKIKIGGLSCFVETGVPVGDVEVTEDAVGEFWKILSLLSDIFEVSTSAVHIFYGMKGGLVAFNTGGQLFFNLRCYQQYSKGKAARKGSGQTLDEDQVFWYTVFCHELAHNVETAHNQRHGAVMEACVVKYMAKFVTACQSLE